MAQLTQEELQSIKDLQSKYNQTILEIGAAEAQLIVFQENIEKLQEAKKGFSDLACQIYFFLVLLCLFKKIMKTIKFIEVFS